MRKDLTHSQKQKSKPQKGTMIAADSYVALQRYLKDTPYK